MACSKARRRVASSAEPVIPTTHQRRRLSCPFRKACHRRQEQRLCRAPPSTVRVPINQDRLRKMTEHGLTEYQARVYLTLLDLGSATASQLCPLSKDAPTRSPPTR